MRILLSVILCIYQYAAFIVTFLIETAAEVIVIYVLTTNDRNVYNLLDF